VTGSSQVPIEGFSQLKGMHGKAQKFTIQKIDNTENLPNSHTCFNQLDLPNYENEEKMRDKLLVAIKMGSEGFGFA